MSPTSTPARFRAQHTRRICDDAHLVWERMQELAGGQPTVDVNMRDVINELFPEHMVLGSSGRGRKSTLIVQTEQAITFHAEISIFLKYSDMVKMVRPPAPMTKDGPRPTQWALAPEWVDVDDEVILARSQRMQHAANAGADNPVHRIHATAPDEPEVAVLRTEDGEHEVAVTAIPDTLVIDPVSAIQQVIMQNAELKVKNAELTARVGELETMLDGVCRENQQMADRWAALRGLLDFEADR